MIWGLEMLSLTVKQNNCKKFSFFFLFFFSLCVCVCTHLYLWKISPSWKELGYLYFSTKQFKVFLQLSTKLCSDTDSLTLEVLTLW